MSLKSKQELLIIERVIYISKLKYIQMENSKTGSAGRTLKNTNGKINCLEQQVFNNFNSKRLGGICLYNQNYRRHIEKQQKISNQKFFNNNDDQKKNIKRFSTVQSQAIKAEQQHMFFNQDKISQIKNNHQLASQISKVIHDLKHSQSLAVKLIQQIRKKKKQQDFTFLPFQELFQLIVIKNSPNFRKVFHKFQLQFNRKVNQELEKIVTSHLQFEKRKKQQDYINATTQTYPDFLIQEVQNLRKQLQLKKIEYNILYKHKDQSNVQNSLQIQQKLYEQGQRHHNRNKVLQQMVKEKSEECKKLRNQLKNVQNNLLSKVIQLQKHENIYHKESQLPCIEEDQLCENVGAAKRKSVFSKQNYVKQNQNVNRRGGSVLFTPKPSLIKLNQNVISSSKDFDEISCCEKQQFVDLDSSLHQTKQLSSKISQSRLNHMKNYIHYQNYQNSTGKSTNKDRLLKTQNSKKNIGNSLSKLFEGLESDAQDSRANESNKLLNNLQKKNENQSQNNSQIRISLHSALKCEGRLSIQTHQNTYNQNKNENKANSVFSKKSSTKNYPKLENKMIIKIKKVKKGVSFHAIKAETSLKMCKQVMNIVIKNILNQHFPIKLQQQKPLIQKVQTLSREGTEKIKLKKERRKQTSYFQLKSLQNQKIKEQKSRHALYINDENQSNHIINTQTEFNDPCRFSWHHPKEISSLSAKKCTLNSVSQLNEKVRNLVRLCPTKQQFKQQFKKLHRNCEENCRHWMKYIQNFYKMKQSLRSAMKLSCQNINDHIRCTNKSVNLRD